ncbi:MAG: RNA methyltransferase [Planctomycetia bacterium]|nr:RNA methyltransferase [Planctomycetia bacterium]
MLITSVSNPHIKYAVRLRESRQRRRDHCFLVDGVRETTRAFVSGYKFREVYVLPEEERQASRHFNDLNALLIRLREKNVTVFETSSAVAEKIAFGNRHEGIVALVEEPQHTLDALASRLPECPLIGIIEGIEKPGNTGAVYRSADGAGLDAMILAAPETDLYNPNAIRASLGTIFHMPTAIASTAETLDWLKRHEIQVAAALCDHAAPYQDYDYRQPTAIALGCEADGLSERWRDQAYREFIHPVRLPMLGIADSLNISNAAAVLFYHARFVR